jgi:hypothetical protein
MTKSINWLGVVAALVFGQALSFVWYGKLFGPQLHDAMAASARTPLGMAEGAGLALLMIVGLAVILGRMGAKGWAGGAAAGALLWLVLPFLGELMNVVYMGEGRVLFLANAGYTLIFMTVTGALLAGLQLPMAKAAA